MSDRIEVRYTEWFIAELEELPADQQARVVARLVLLERKGWGISVRDRDVVHLQDGIYEVRVVGTGAAYRVLGFVEPGHPGRLVVATSCVSKGSMKKAGVMAGEHTRARNRRALWRNEGHGRGPMEREDGRDMTTAELLARLGRNPAFVAAWDLEAPKVVVAANVSRLRHRRGMTQRQLAEAAGMRQPRIAEIECGLANPQIETLARIAHALEVDLSVLHRANDATHASVPFAARRVPSHAARTRRRAAPPTDLA